MATISSKLIIHALPKDWRRPGAAKCAQASNRRRSRAGNVAGTTVMPKKQLSPPQVKLETSHSKRKRSKSARMSARSPNTLRAASTTLV